ncbi:hypothetical protein INT45_011078 [Circinella minor]|uniref:Uncharacterized protein n=1 Tax=Circinella minor TaxID=1195481 RepID=A0A8H7SHD9_9FUNG|nr:hypothetical protein INT45_011078 [Circinella minor]
MRLNIALSVAALALLSTIRASPVPLSRRGEEVGYADEEKKIETAFVSTKVIELPVDHDKNMVFVFPGKNHKDDEDNDLDSTVIVVTDKDDDYSDEYDYDKYGYDKKFGSHKSKRGDDYDYDYKNDYDHDDKDDYDYNYKNDYDHDDKDDYDHDDKNDYDYDNNKASYYGDDKGKGEFVGSVVCYADQEDCSKYANKVYGSYAVYGAGSGYAKKDDEEDCSDEEYKYEDGSYKDDDDHSKYGSK